MHRRQAWFSLSVLFLFTLLSALPSWAEPNPLIARIPASQRPPLLPAGTEIERVVLKLHEGTQVRLRDRILVAGGRDARQLRDLARRGLTAARVDADLAALESLIATAPQVRGLQRLFRVSEEKLAAYRQKGEAQSGRELADLDLYFELRVPPHTTFAEVAGLVAALSRFESVETAYAVPPAQPATLGRLSAAAVPTANFQGQQSYLNAAPAGIGALSAWTVAGGRGQGVRIVDVEGAWRLTHDDLPSFFHTGVDQINDLSWRNHGTAVAGILVAPANGFGVTGIANQAIIGFESINSQSHASAVTNAALAAGPGGFVVIELQVWGPANSSPCICENDQCDLVPIELFQDNFDAIAAATANGITVVEAAGNGSSNLDDAVYNSVFLRSHRDSGAILVAGSPSNEGSATCWTNWGSRIDAHGWGEDVVTTAYGDLFNGGSEDSWYTAFFSGTSSATPIVAGSAASVQGVAMASPRGRLSPQAIRRLLTETGTPQVAGPKNIGPLPNLPAAILRLQTDQPPTAKLTFTCSGLSCSFSAAGSADDNGILSYAWSWGDSTSGSGATASHTFARGSYTVTLTVSDTLGATATKSKRVTVTNDPVPAAESYFPLAPCRVYDSRPNAKLDSNQARLVDVAGLCGIPAAAKAVSFSVIASEPTDAGHLIFYPADQTPSATTTLNFAVATSPRANNAILSIGGNGKLGILPFVLGTSGRVHVILDVQGYFTESSGGLGFQTVTPCRAADTRPNPLTVGAVRSFPIKGVCGVPSNAAAASLNLTVSQPTGAGHVTLFPAGLPAVPPVSSINFMGGISALDNGALTTLAAGTPDLSAQYISQLSTATADVILDVNGYFHPTAPLKFRPIAACRAVDTRFADQGAPALAHGTTRSFQIRGNCGVPLGAKAAVLNMTVVGPTASGHLRAFPSGIAAPAAGTINFDAGEGALANGTIVPLSVLADDLSIFTVTPGGSTHLIIDVFGYFQ